MSFAYAKVNKSHPIRGAVIFRMKGKCTVLERFLDSKFKTRSSILDPWNSRLDPLDARLYPWKFQESSLASLNLLLSGTVSPKCGQTGDVKPLTTNRSLSYAVKWPTWILRSLFTHASLWGNPWYKLLVLMSINLHCYSINSRCRYAYLRYKYLFHEQWGGLNFQ